MPATSLTARPLLTRWFRFVFPSVSDLLFLVLLFSLTGGILAPRLLGDAGIGWHIRNGELMVHSHTITRADLFSSTMNGQAWYAWEWLYDVTIACVHGWLGLNGVVFFSAVIIAACFALVLRLALVRGASLPVALVLTLLSAGASTIHFLARPHVLSWLLIVIWFQTIDAYAAGALRARRLVWLPVSMVLWTNLHGGFVVGLVLLGLYLVGGVVDYFTGPDAERALSKQRVAHLARITTLAFAATFVNPYGYKLHLHVYQYLSSRFLMDHIDEFLSPNFHGIAQQCFAALLLVSLVALTVKRERLPVSRFLVLLFAVYSGLYASRNLPVACMLLTLIVAPMLTEGLSHAAGEGKLAPRLGKFSQRYASFSARMGNLETQLRGHVWPVTAVFLLLWICAHGGWLGPNHLVDAHFDATRFPVQAATIIEQRNLPGPVFCPDNWGGYLIYRLYPAVQVVVDDRHDLYGEDFLKNYLKVVRLEPGWDGVIDDWKVNWVLVPSGSTLANALEEVPGWTTDYRDQTAILFQRVVAGR